MLCLRLRCHLNKGGYLVCIVLSWQSGAQNGRVCFSSIWLILSLQLWHWLFFCTVYACRKTAPYACFSLQLSWTCQAEHKPATYLHHCAIACRHAAVRAVYQSSHGDNHASHGGCHSKLNTLARTLLRPVLPSPGGCSELLSAHITARAGAASHGPARCTRPAFA